MRELKFNVWKIISSAIVLTLVLVWGIMDMWYDDTAKIINIVLNYGFITLFFVIVWWLLDNYLWHTKPIQNKIVRDYFGIAPDLRGRWEGTIERSPEDSHPFVIEIAQTMTCIQKISCYSRRGRSDSITHNFTCDGAGDDYMLCFYWQGTHGKRGKEITESSTFYGFSRLAYRETSEGRFLEGDYFTNRQPDQTMGKTKFRFKSLKLEKKH